MRKKKRKKKKEQKKKQHSRRIYGTQVSIFLCPCLCLCICICVCGNVSLSACCMLHSIHWKPQIDAYHLQGTRQTKVPMAAKLRNFEMISKHLNHKHDPQNDHRRWLRVWSQFVKYFGMICISLVNSSLFTFASSTVEGIRVLLRPM